MCLVFTGELAAVPMSRLEAVCKEQDAKWLHRLSLGIDDEEVLTLLHVPAALHACILKLRQCSMMTRIQCGWIIP